MKVLPQERQRAVFAAALLDPPKEMKQKTAREGEKGGQLTLWTENEHRPALGGELWEAVQEKPLQEFADDLFKKRFGKCFLSLYFFGEI